MSSLHLCSSFTIALAVPISKSGAFPHPPVAQLPAWLILCAQHSKAQGTSKYLGHLQLPGEFEVSRMQFAHWKLASTPGLLSPVLQKGLGEC